MKRPENLPDFENPPINEVVMGVQFAPVQGYQQINAGEVWNLFKKDFPIVQEQPAIPPSFETFGFTSPPISFGFMSGANHDRFWFLKDDQRQIIQFQQDKFLHNWRKVGIDEEKYPRFENIISNFSAELKTLEVYFQKNFSTPSISVNQCEIAYINFIYKSDVGDIPLNEIFAFLNFENEPNELSCSFSKHILNPKGEPRGRVVCNIEQGVGPKGPMHRLSITAKGAPNGNGISDALLFIQEGREKIVHLFKEITSPTVHKLWGIK